MMTPILLIILVMNSASAEQGCAGGKADIVLLLDSSGSVGLSNFKMELSFVSNFVQGFTVGQDAMQFSLVTFSSQVYSQFDFFAYQSKEDLLDAISSVKYRSGGTVTGTALKYVREKSYLPSNGARPSVRKIVVVVTDGISVQPSETSMEANLLHQDGILVISVGVGNNVNLKELDAIATNSSLVFSVQDFHGLNAILGDLQSTTCMQVMDDETCGIAALPDSMSMTSSSCEWPWFVRVRLGTGVRFNQKCGGVLIKRNKVLTTASCIERYGAHSVVLGGQGNPVTVKVISTTFHPSYEGKANDIAVLKLQKGVGYNQCILPACLPVPRETCDPISLDNCKLTGWSIVRGSYFQLEPQLRVGSAEYLAPDLCSLVFKYGKSQTIPASTNCIGPLKENDRPTRDNEGGMLRCKMNSSWVFVSLLNDPSNDSFPSYGVDLRDPMVLNFIKDN